MTEYPRIIAHRCGGALAPENSLPGLRIAARLGCRGVEFDVMLSADGVPLLIHDETLDRTTTGHGRVAELSAADILRFDAGAPHHKAYAVLPSLTFAEALTECHALGLWANVEIKPSQGHDEATARVVAATVAASPHAARCLFSSFSRTAIAIAREVAPAVPRALLFDELPDDWAALARNHGCVGIHLNGGKIDAQRIAAMRAAGLRVACYTINRKADATALFAAGVDAVFTDRPDQWSAAEM